MRKSLFLCLIILILLTSCSTEENQSQIVSGSPAEISNVSPKGFIEIPDEYKNLDVGKAICAINDSNGYVVDISTTFLEESYSIRIIEKDGCSRIIRKTNNNTSSTKEDILIVNDKIYSLNEEEKTYFELTEYDDETKLFSNLKYIETSSEKIENIEYSVDKFFSETNENETINFYTRNGNIDFVKIVWDKEYILNFSITEGALPELLDIPNEYVMVGLSQTIEKYFFVPDNLKNKLLGQTFEKLDLEEGFSITFNVIDDENNSHLRGYSYTFKGNMAHFSEYYYKETSENGYIREELYKNGKKYSYPFSITEDPTGVGLGFESFFLDGYVYKETFSEECFSEEKDTYMTCQVERYVNKNGEVLDFYFESNSLFDIVKNDENYYVQVLTGENVDDSVFDRLGN